jgi:hypothetical protein
MNRENLDEQYKLNSKIDIVYFDLYPYWSKTDDKGLSKEMFESLINDLENLAKKYPFLSDIQIGDSDWIIDGG